MGLITLYGGMILAVIGGLFVVANTGPDRLPTFPWGWVGIALCVVGVGLFLRTTSKS